MQAAAAYTDFSQFASLRRDARRDAQASAGEVAGQFEALFVQMMLKSMRDAVPRGGLFGSHQLETYEQMHDRQVSLELSRQGGIGLAEVIERQLSGAPRAGTGSIGAFNALPARVPSQSPVQAQAPAGATGKPEPDWDGSTPEAFLQSLAPHARRAAGRLGVEPDVLLAQAALETGWGRHVLEADGRSSNNLFNIKAGGDWEGATVQRAVVEYRDGVAVREAAAFRAYPSAAEAFDDYVDLVATSPRYRDALAAGDGDSYLRELQRAGYATDPAYADKVMDVRSAIAGRAQHAALKLSDGLSL